MKEPDELVSLDILATIATHDNITPKVRRAMQVVQERLARSRSYLLSCYEQFRERSPDKNPALILLHKKSNLASWTKGGAHGKEAQKRLRALSPLENWLVFWADVAFILGNSPKPKQEKNPVFHGEAKNKAHVWVAVYDHDGPVYFPMVRESWEEKLRPEHSN